LLWELALGLGELALGLRELALGLRELALGLRELSLRVGLSLRVLWSMGLRVLLGLRLRVTNHERVCCAASRLHAASHLSPAGTAKALRLGSKAHRLLRLHAREAATHPHASSLGEALLLRHAVRGRGGGGRATKPAEPPSLGRHAETTVLYGELAEAEAGCRGSWCMTEAGCRRCRWGTKAGCR
jgi:hypothetical protein